MYHSKYNYFKIFLDDESLFPPIHKYIILDDEQKKYYQKMKLDKLFSHISKLLHYEDIIHFLDNILNNIINNNRIIIKNSDVCKFIKIFDNHYLKCVDVSLIKIIKLMLKNMNFKMNNELIDLFLKNNEFMNKTCFLKKLIEKESEMKLIYEYNIKNIEKQFKVKNKRTVNREYFITQSDIINLLDNNYYKMTDDDIYYLELNDFVLNNVIGMNINYGLYDKRKKETFKNDITLEFLIDLIKCMNGKKTLFFIAKNIINLMIDMKYDIDINSYKSIFMEYCRLSNNNEYIGKLFDYVFKGAKIIKGKHNETINLIYY